MLFADPIRWYPAPYPARILSRLLSSPGEDNPLLVWHRWILHRNRCQLRQIPMPCFRIPLPIICGHFPFLQFSSHHSLISPWSTARYLMLLLYVFSPSSEKKHAGTLSCSLWWATHSQHFACLGQSHVHGQNSTFAHPIIITSIFTVIQTFSSLFSFRNTYSCTEECSLLKWYPRIQV